MTLPCSIGGWCPSTSVLGVLPLGRAHERDSVHLFVGEPISRQCPPLGKTSPIGHSLKRVRMCVCVRVFVRVCVLCCALEWLPDLVLIAQPKANIRSTPPRVSNGRFFCWLNPTMRAMAVAVEQKTSRRAKHAQTLTRTRSRGTAKST